METFDLDALLWHLESKEAPNFGRILDETLEWYIGAIIEASVRPN